MGPRVLHVAQPTTGGVAHYLAPLAADQVRRGWDVTVACPDGGHLATQTRAGGAQHVAWSAVRSPGANVVAESAALRRVLRSARPDILHLHSSKAGLVGRLLVRGRLPTLFQPHGWSWLAVSGPTATVSRRWERAGARWADRVICVSEAERSLGTAIGMRARWAVIRTGVDLGKYRPSDHTARAAARDRLGLGDAPLGVCVGRLSQAKGQDRLARLWSEVRAQVPGAELALVGDGELRPAIAASVSDGVTIVGERSDVPDWYLAADVVVVPSRWDALSLSLVEAAASGSCVVATDVPGAREVLGEGGRGAVVPLNDERALVDAICLRLLDPRLAAEEGAALARYAAVQFDRRQTYDALDALMLEVLREPTP